MEVTSKPSISSRIFIKGPIVCSICGGGVALTHATVTSSSLFSVNISLSAIDNGSIETLTPPRSTRSGLLLLLLPHKQCVKLY